MTAWLSAFVPLVVITTILWWRHGPRYALGASVPLSFLAPTWFLWEIGGLPISVRVAVTGWALLLYVCHPQGKIDWRLSALDLAGLGVMGANLISDLLADGFSLGIPIRIYGEWTLPYVAARLAFRSMDDVRRVAPLVAAVSAVLAFGAILECLTRINLWELPFGERPRDGFPHNAIRYGFRRAYGPTMHPIYFGMLQLLMLAWTFALPERFSQKIRLSVLILSIAGITATVSRGPFLALIPAGAVALFLRYPRYHVVIGTVSMAGMLLLALSYQQVANILMRTGGEKKAHRIVLNDGRVIDATGTSNRVLLFIVYADSMKEAGVFGFGTEAVSHTPPKIPFLPRDDRARWKLQNVDNFYILFVLRCGFVGLMLICLTLFLAVLRSVRLVPAHPDFFAALAGILISAALVMITVWMPFDYGFALLWCMGLVAGFDLHAVPHRFYE